MDDDVFSVWQREAWAGEPAAEPQRPPSLQRFDYCGVIGAAAAGTLPPVAVTPSADGGLGCSGAPSPSAFLGQRRVPGLMPPPIQAATEGIGSDRGHCNDDWNALGVRRLVLQSRAAAKQQLSTSIEELTRERDELRESLLRCRQQLQIAQESRALGVENGKLKKLGRSEKAWAEAETRDCIHRLSGAFEGEMQSLKEPLEHSRGERSHELGASARRDSLTSAESGLLLTRAGGVRDDNITVARPSSSQLRDAVGNYQCSVERLLGAALQRNADPQEVDSRADALHEAQELRCCLDATNGAAAWEQGKLKHQVEAAAFETQQPSATRRIVEEQAPRDHLDSERQPAKLCKKLEHAKYAANNEPEYEEQLGELKEQLAAEAEAAKKAQAAEYQHAWAQKDHEAAATLQALQLEAVKHAAAIKQADVERKLQVALKQNDELMASRDAVAAECRTMQDDLKATAAAAERLTLELEAAAAKLAELREKQSTAREREANLKLLLAAILGDESDAPELQELQADVETIANEMADDAGSQDLEFQAMRAAAAAASENMNKVAVDSHAPEMEAWALKKSLAEAIRQRDAGAAQHMKAVAQMKRNHDLELPRAREDAVSKLAESKDQLSVVEKCEADSKALLASDAQPQATERAAVSAKLAERQGQLAEALEQSEADMEDKVAELQRVKGELKALAEAAEAHERELQRAREDAANRQEELAAARQKLEELQAAREMDAIGNRRVRKKLKKARRDLAALKTEASIVASGRRAQLESIKQAAVAAGKKNKIAQTAEFHALEMEVTAKSAACALENLLEEALGMADHGGAEFLQATSKDCHTQKLRSGRLLELQSFKEAGGDNRIVDPEALLASDAQRQATERAAAPAKLAEREGQLSEALNHEANREAVPAQTQQAKGKLKALADVHVRELRRAREDATDGQEDLAAAREKLVEPQLQTSAHALTAEDPHDHLAVLEPVAPRGLVARQTAIADSQSEMAAGARSHVDGWAHKKSVAPDGVNQHSAGRRKDTGQPHSGDSETGPAEHQQSWMMEPTDSARRHARQLGAAEADLLALEACRDMLRMWEQHRNQENEVFVSPVPLRVLVEFPDSAWLTSPSEQPQDDGPRKQHGRGNGPGQQVEPLSNGPSQATAATTRSYKTGGCPRLPPDCGGEGGDQRRAGGRQLDSPDALFPPRPNTGSKRNAPASLGGRTPGEIGCHSCRKKKAKGANAEVLKGCVLCNPARRVLLESGCFLGCRACKFGPKKDAKRCKPKNHDKIRPEPWEWRMLLEHGDSDQRRRALEALSRADLCMSARSLYLRDHPREAQHEMKAYHRPGPMLDRPVDARQADQLLQGEKASVCPSGQATATGPQLHQRQEGTMGQTAEDISDATLARHSIAGSDQLQDSLSDHHRQPESPGNVAHQGLSRLENRKGVEGSQLLPRAPQSPAGPNDKSDDWTHSFAVPVGGWIAGKVGCRKCQGKSGRRGGTGSLEGCEWCNPARRVLLDNGCWQGCRTCKFPSQQTRSLLKCTISSHNKIPPEAYEWRMILEHGDSRQRDLARTKLTEEQQKMSARDLYLRDHPRGFQMHRKHKPGPPADQPSSHPQVT